MVPRSNSGLRSGSLAKATGVSPDTIRHYERIGILPKASRTVSGYRIYPESAVERVRAAQRAIRIGFTLAELADVFTERDAGRVPCRRVYEMAQQKLDGIRADIVALKRTEKTLQAVLSDWEQRMSRAGSGQRSHLLQSLTATIGSSGMKRRFRRKPT
jgi:MerR family mercuric resistance operon transcriptional regulator